MAVPRPRPLAYLMIAMATGETFLALALSLAASMSSLKSWQIHGKVELPLWFAILPALTALGVSLHLRSARHIDRTCPWASLGWIILAANALALMLFMQMTR